MDPNAFPANFFKWDPRSALPPSNRTVEPPVTVGLEELFQAYGVRYYTAAKLGELGFTVNTLLDMTDEELDEMMDSLCHIFRWDLLVGERYGVKAAVRAERRRLDAFSQQEPASGGAWELAAGSSGKPRKSNSKRRPATANSMEEEDDEGTEDDGCGERQREHPFIVTEPGEVARGKKNGLDYLFHLYEVCHELLIQVQNIARERGEKCPTKVTNQVFRYAHSVGATYINKPKMRHYVHCYALHCLDEAASNELRRGFKERRENVGAWRQGCYMPLVAIASRHDWDMDAVFNTHPRLSIWYVPTKLRQLCHAERSNASTAAASSSVSGGGGGNLPF